MSGALFGFFVHSQHRRTGEDMDRNAVLPFPGDLWKQTIQQQKVLMQLRNFTLVLLMALINS